MAIFDFFRRKDEQKSINSDIINIEKRLNLLLITIEKLESKIDYYTSDFKKWKRKALHIEEPTQEEDTESNKNMDGFDMLRGIGI